MKRIIREEDYFYPKTIKRGKEYYDKGNVLSCTKIGDKYYAKVKGNYNKTYNVLIANEKDFYMECTCPFVGSCKHEYAVLLSIAKNEYEEKKIKKVPKEKETKIKDLMSEIPARELKDYLMVNIDTISFDKNSFENNFIKYLPEQDYKYYYNTLYNSYVIEGLNYELLDNYFTRIDSLISVNKYYEAFKIIKAITQVSNDLDLYKKHDYLQKKMKSIEETLKVIRKKIDRKHRKEVDELNITK